MKQLAYNKFGSVVFVLGLLAALVLCTPEHHHSLLLSVVMLLGYAHYLIGGYYQVQSAKRLDHPNKMHGYFCFVAGLSCVGVLLAINAGMMPLLSIIAITIFICHGALNERTHVERFTSCDTGNVFWLGMACFISSLTLASLQHPRFFFSPFGDYAFINTQEAQALLFTLIPEGLYYTLGCVLLFVGLIMMVRKFTWLARLFVAGLVMAVGYIIWIYHIPDYTYVFYTLLVYHFITWAFFGAQIYKKGSPRLHFYLSGSIAVHVVLGLVCFLEWYFHTSILFNFYVFIVGTYVHILTSFLNEPWAKKLLQIS